MSDELYRINELTCVLEVRRPDSVITRFDPGGIELVTLLYRRELKFLNWKSGASRFSTEEFRVDLFATAQMLELSEHSSFYNPLAIKTFCYLLEARAFSSHLRTSQSAILKSPARIRRERSFSCRNELIFSLLILNFTKCSWPLVI